MTQAEFQAHIESDDLLRRRFIVNPKAVLTEYRVDNELSDAELDCVSGGTVSEPEFVHRVLTSIFSVNGPY